MSSTASSAINTAMSRPSNHPPLFRACVASRGWDDEHPSGHSIRLASPCEKPWIHAGGRVAIALGIGVNSMMFTIYNATLFKTLPFENPRRIVHIHTRNLVEGWDRRGFEVTPLDLVTFVSIPVMLSAIVLAACLVPARRAARLSAVDALRTE